MNSIGSSLLIQCIITTKDEAEIPTSHRHLFHRPPRFALFHFPNHHHPPRRHVVGCQFTFVPYISSIRNSIRRRQGRKGKNIKEDQSTRRNTEIYGIFLRHCLCNSNANINLFFSHFVLTIYQIIATNIIISTLSFNTMRSPSPTPSDSSRASSKRSLSPSPSIESQSPLENNWGSSGWGKPINIAK